jgi:hypothetical protein
MVYGNLVFNERGVLRLDVHCHDLEDLPRARKLQAALLDEVERLNEAIEQVGGLEDGGDR